MREIIFRAWDNIRKIMTKSYTLSRLIENSTEWGLTEGKRANMADFDFIPLQYTGLKDNTKWEHLTEAEQREWIDRGETKDTWNGKEIYEGDIAAFDRDGKEYWRELYEIRYLPYWACWQLFLLKKANHVDSPQYISNALTQGEADTISIIGNIYENPELLEK